MPAQARSQLIWVPWDRSCYGSTEPATHAYYRELAKQPHVRIVEWTKPFNYAAVNNFAATLLAMASGSVSTSRLNSRTSAKLRPSGSRSDASIAGPRT